MCGCCLAAACRYMSSGQHSHTSVVGDVCWLPGIEVDRTGKVFPIRANSAGTSAQVSARTIINNAAGAVAMLCDDPHLLVVL
jgi:hypothetical protein